MKTGTSNNVEYKLILLVSAIYSTIVIFPAYGPILAIYSSPEESLVFSTLFLFSFSIGIFVIPVLNANIHSALWKLFCIFSIVMVLFFPAFGFAIRCMTMVSSGIFTARFLLIWSVSYLAENIKMSYGKFFTLILFLSYATLYAFNVASPDLPGSIAIFFPAVGFISLMALDDNSSKFPQNNTRFAHVPPLKYLFPIFLIYISAGITYSGIYPLIAKFELYERFYNVLPFLAALPVIFFVHKKRSVKTLLWIGISLLGFSFLFNIYDLHLWNYLVIQTLLQSGWAFMNSFVWLFTSNLARINRNPFYFSSTIAAFLLGTSTGSAVFISISSVFDSPHVAFIGLLPLLGVLVFTQTIPDNLRKDMADFESDHLDALTRREKEIFLMLLENMKNKDIATDLNISSNTMKKHCGSIYRKLYVENKTELIKVYGNMETAN